MRPSLPTMLQLHYAPTSKSNWVHERLAWKGRTTLCHKCPTIEWSVKNARCTEISSKSGNDSNGSNDSTTQWQAPAMHGIWGPVAMAMYWPIAWMAGDLKFPIYLLLFPSTLIYIPSHRSCCPEQFLETLKTKVLALSWKQSKLLEAAPVFLHSTKTGSSVRGTGGT